MSQWNWVGDQNALDQALQITGDSVGVDTEFVRETTFWPVPGLIQIGNAQSVALIDPLADMEWSGFSEWMKNPDQTKVMHAGFEDLELFARHFDVHPTPYFDTQIAQACLGGPISMGLDPLVRLHGFPGLDKSKSRNDWTIRPLARDLLDYAAQDVVHLPDIASQQRERLIELDRLSWLVEEQQVAIARIRVHLSGELDPMDRMKGLHYLDGRGLTTVRALVHWREQVARSTNTARSRVARDEFLLALGAAVDWPKHPMKLEGARSSFKHIVTKVVPVGRYGRPEEVANIALFLASDLASYISAASIDVSGGMQGQLSYYPTLKSDLHKEGLRREAEDK